MVMVRVRVMFMAAITVMARIMVSGGVSFWVSNLLGSGKVYS